MRLDPSLTNIVGLERLYSSKQPWIGDQYPDCLLPDPWNAAFLFNGAFDGAAETQAAEAIYREVRRVAEVCAMENRPCYCAETGCADGYTSCFIARAILDGTGSPYGGRVFTCEYVETRSDGQLRPWPKLWQELGLAGLITAKIGDSRLVETWERYEPKLPKKLDVVFIDSDHTQEQVIAEWRLLGPRIDPGGVVLFHDVAIREFAGVARAVSQIADELDVDIELLNSSRGLAKIVVPARV